MRNKGIVLENEGHKHIVLTSHGAFKVVYLRNQVSIGEEICWGRKFQRPDMGWVKPISILAASIVVLLMVSILSLREWGFSSKAVAYVSYDLNPSIEMSINRKGTVLTAYGINDDGKKVVDSIIITNKHVEDVVVLITEKTMDLGYFSLEENVILISLTELIEVDNVVLEKLVANVQQVAQQKQVVLKVEAIQTNKEERETAKSLGVSSGRLVVSRLAEEKGLSITEEELNRGKLTQVLKEKGLDTEELRREIKRYKEDKLPYGKQQREKESRYSKSNKSKDKGEQHPSTINRQNHNINRGTSRR